jgi:hypothetical protein
MKTAWIILFITSIAFVSCKSQYGEKLKDPFSGNKYESNARFFRAVGKAQSRDENIALKKARLEAKSELASQMNSTLKEVADDYMSSTGYENADEITNKFQSLTRMVVNTDIADLRVIGQEKYFDGNTYTAFTAYEIKKNAMFRFLKKQAKTNAKLNDSERKIIEDMIDQELKKLEE